MIKFFHKIRQSMIKDNKASKYLIYAIGEIVLVVIGILIALQINTWNESKKNRAFEIKMLAEVKTALVKDKNYFKAMENRLKAPDSITTLVIDLIDKKTVFNDTMYPLLSTLKTGITYQYNPGPYEAIKSSGIDKISNDSLRNNLINFYDFDFPRHKYLTMWYDRDYENLRIRLDLLRNKTPFIDVNSKGEKQIYHEYQKDIFSNPEFLLFLRDNRGRINNVLRQFEYFQYHIQEMIDQIDKEIKQ